MFVAYPPLCLARMRRNYRAALCIWPRHLVCKENVKLRSQLVHAGYIYPPLPHRPLTYPPNYLRWPRALVRYRDSRYFPDRNDIGARRYTR